MALEFSPASAEDDLALQEFLSGLGVPVPSAWWARAFSPEAPPGAASRPFLVRDLDEGTLVAFGATRGAELSFGDGTVGAQVLHDLFCTGDENGARGMSILLGELIRQATISFAAGPSLRASIALDAAHWQRAGWFLRARMDAPSNKPSPAPAGLVADEGDQSPPGPDGPVARFVRSAECRHWLAHAPETPPAEHWRLDGAFEASVRPTPGSLPGATENLVVDLQINEGDVTGAFRRLGEAGQATGRATYLSVMAPQVLTAVRQAGWSLLKPRWSLYWTVGGPSGRELAGELATCRHWWVTPMDVELDRVPVAGAGEATPPPGTP